MLFMFDYKIIFAVLAIILAIYTYVRYMRQTIKGALKPHAFTWGLWGILTVVVFFAQHASEAGPGSWLTGTTAVGCLAIAVLSAFKGERDYTRSDWILLIGALVSIALWPLTKTPLYSVILASLINLAAFWPTIRKSWGDPHHESARVFILDAVVCALSIVALDKYSVTTVLYPATIVLVNTAFVCIVYMRRSKLHEEAARA